MKMRPLTEAEQAAIIEPLRQRKSAYQTVFGAAGGQTVRDDLARFCRAERSCFDVDPRKHAVLEGRREVWLRIQEHLTMTPEQLALLYRAAVPDVENPEEKEEE